MAPYFASAFGVFLMRQTFRAIPRDFEEAAMLDGADPGADHRHVLLPLARPGLVAFAIVSVTAHWNEFLWPLMAVSSPSNQVLTVGLASFTSGAEAGSEWGVVAAGTFLVAAPLLLAVPGVPAALRFVLYLLRHQITGEPHDDHPTFRLGGALRRHRLLRRCRAARPTEIDLFFPVPVQGKLADEMQRAGRRASTRSTPDIHVDRRSIPAATTTPT